MEFIGMQISEMQSMKDIFKVGNKAFKPINDYGFFFPALFFFLVSLHFYFRK